MKNINKILLCALLGTLTFNVVSCNSGNNNSVKLAEVTEPVKAPQLNAIQEKIKNSNPQSDMPVLDYASKNKVVFHTSLGLIVYDTSNRSICGNVDLSEIKLSSVKISVSQDEKEVYIYSEENTSTGYKYNIDSDKLEETNDITPSNYEMRETLTVLGKSPLTRCEIFSKNCIPVTDNEICFLSASSDSQDLSDLEINIMPDDDSNINGFEVFN